MTGAHGPGAQLGIIVGEISIGGARFGRIAGRRHRRADRRGRLGGVADRRGAGGEPRRPGRRSRGGAAHRVRAVRGGRRAPGHRRAGRGRASRGARRPGPLSAHAGRRRVDREAGRTVPAGAAAQPARGARHRRGPQGAGGPAAHRGVRHRVLSRPATRGCHVCHRPRCRRAVAHPAIRVSRHLTRLRQRTGGGVSWTRRWNR